jgi:hypothetical protein
VKEDLPLRTERPYCRTGAPAKPAAAENSNPYILIIVRQGEQPGLTKPEPATWWLFILVIALPRDLAHFRD